VKFNSSPTFRTPRGDSFRAFVSALGCSVRSGWSWLGSRVLSPLGAWTGYWLSSRLGPWLTTQAGPWLAEWGAYWGSYLGSRGRRFLIAAARILLPLLRMALALLRIALALAFEGLSRLAPELARGLQSAGRAAGRSGRTVGYRVGRGPSGRLTARGGVAAVFAACFLGLLIADWAGWENLAFAVFFMASSLTVYYVRPGSLLPVLVSSPLLFFTAMLAEKFALASGPLPAFEGTVVSLADAAPWLLTGTALTLVIALCRGVAREIRTLVVETRSL
jgi:hypothetical protein